MKQILVTLALVPFFSAPALAAPSASPVEPVTADGVQSLRERFNGALDKLRAAAIERKATREDYQRVLDALAEAAKAYEAETRPAIASRERLQKRIRDLEAAPRGTIDEMGEIDAIKDLAIDVELEYALARLQARAIAGNWSRADYQAMVDVLTARAESAKTWNPEIESIVARMRSALSDLQKRVANAKPTAEDFEMLRAILSEARISQAITRLEKRSAEKKAVAADYEDVAAGAKLLSGPDLADLQKRVQDRLDAIRDAVQAGRITREEFVLLRDMILKRAREASYAK